MLPRLSVVALALLNIHSAYSAPTLFSGSYPSRMTGQFLTGDNRQLAGFVDGMIPLMQDNDRLFFADGTFMLGRYQRAMYSGGMGYRQMTDTKLGKGIWGVYGFADYYQTALNSGFWQLNPGLEWLNEHYELRLQGYIPVNTRSTVYQNTFASALPSEVISDSGQNISALNYASGHQVFDTPVNWLEESGVGVELEGGRFFNYGKGVWLRLGGYHFDYQTAKSINGVEGNIEMLMTKGASLIIQNNYDNQNKNMFSVGVRISLGGSAEPIGTLAQRMTSPIIRHQARQSFGEAAPTRQSFEATGPTFVAYNNVWFFSPTGSAPLGAGTTLANCTAENPCLTIDTDTATQIGALTPNANLFFASGNYVLPPQAGQSWVGLVDGQSVWGRNTGWLQAANGLDRPLINGGLNWNSSLTASGAVYDMRVFNDNQIIPDVDTDFGGAVRMGIGANGSIVVGNTDVRVIANGQGVGNSNAAAVFAGQNARIDSSTMSVANSSTGTADTVSFGIVALGDATVSNSQISLESSAAIDNESYGIVAVGDLIVSNSQVSLDDSAANDNDSYGISAQGDVMVSNSQVSLDGSAGVDNQSYGIAAQGDVTVSNSQVSLDGSAGVDNEGYGIRAQSNATVSNSQVSLAGSAGVDNESAGIFVFGAATVSNSQISVSGTAGNNHDSFGIVVTGNATINNSQISMSTTAVADNDSLGIVVTGDATVSNSQISLSATAGDNNDSAGIFANGDATVSNSQISVSATAGDNNDSAGIFANGDATVSNSQISMSTTAVNDNDTTGVSATNIIFNGNVPSYISVNGSGLTTTVLATAGAVTNNDGSLCSVNGSNPVPCA